jgi:prepilin-type processing-associated H-X9-DG protein
MNETDNNQQTVNQSSPSVSKWGTISFWCAITGWGCFAAGALLVLMLSYLDSNNSTMWPKEWLMPTLAILCINWLLLNLFAFIAGLMGLLKILKNRGRLTGASKSLSGIAFALLVIVPIFLFVLYIRYTFEKITCEENMRGIGKGILLYAADYKDNYPTPEKWCDLLIEKEDFGRKQFGCLGCRRKGDSICSNFALNPYCNINCSNNVVLAFETKAGWNQYGGPELLTFDNHHGNGATILFNDGHVEFIKPKEIGKLKWKADTNQPALR